MLRDPVIQSARLMPTEEEGAGSQEGEGQGEESENPLVGPGITITQPDKIQPIKVYHMYIICTSYMHRYMCLCIFYILSCFAFFLNDKINNIFQFGSKKNEGSQDPATAEVHNNIITGAYEPLLIIIIMIALSDPI